MKPQRPIAIKPASTLREEASTSTSHLANAFERPSDSPGASPKEVELDLFSVAFPASNVKLNEDSVKLNSDLESIKFDFFFMLKSSSRILYQDLCKETHARLIETARLFCAYNPDKKKFIFNTLSIFNRDLKAEIRSRYKDDEHLGTLTNLYDVLVTNRIREENLK